MALINMKVKFKENDEILTNVWQAPNNVFMIIKLPNEQ